MSESKDPGMHLVIVWPESEFLHFRSTGFALIRDHTHAKHTYSVTSYHRDALDNDPDPFSSRYFGRAVMWLLKGSTVVLSDPAFEDPQRRRLVERAFKRTFPKLTVEHMQVAEEAIVGDQDEVEKGITVDAEVYAEGDMCSNESIVVESHAPHELLVAAMTRASERMMLVGEDGQEHGDVEGLEISHAQLRLGRDRRREGQPWVLHRLQGCHRASNGRSVSADPCRGTDALWHLLGARACSLKQG